MFLWSYFFHNYSPKTSRCNLRVNNPKFQSWQLDLFEQWTCSGLQKNKTADNKGTQDQLCTDSYNEHDKAIDSRECKGQRICKNIFSSISNFEKLTIRHIQKNLLFGKVTHLFWNPVLNCPWDGSYPGIYNKGSHICYVYLWEKEKERTVPFRLAKLYKWVEWPEKQTRIHKYKYKQ